MECCRLILERLTIVPNSSGYVIACNCRWLIAQTPADTPNVPRSRVWVIDPMPIACFLSTRYKVWTVSFLHVDSCQITLKAHAVQRRQLPHLSPSRFPFVLFHVSGLSSQNDRHTHRRMLRSPLSQKRHQDSTRTYLNTPTHT